MYKLNIWKNQVHIITTLWNRPLERNLCHDRIWKQSIRRITLQNLGLSFAKLLLWQIRFENLSTVSFKSLLFGLLVQDLEFPVARMAVTLPLVNMHKHNVFLQMCTAQKLPFAHVTFKLLLPCVCLHVCSQLLCRKEALAANGTCMQSFWTVNLQVAFQVCHTSILLPACVTRVMTLPSVKTIYMHLEMAQ